MTETTQVTQADMQAAATFVEDHGWLIDEGEEWGDLHPNDQATLAKAFARHRTQALADAAAEAEPVACAVDIRCAHEVLGLLDVTSSPPRWRDLTALLALHRTRPLADHRALVEALGMIRVMLNDHAGKQSIEGDAFKIADATLAALKETDNG